jgi:hypothetical protein
MKLPGAMVAWQFVGGRSLLATWIFFHVAKGRQRNPVVNLTDIHRMTGIEASDRVISVLIV